MEKRKTSEKKDTIEFQNFYMQGRKCKCGKGGILRNQRITGKKTLDPQKVIRIIENVNAKPKMS